MRVGEIWRNITNLDILEVVIVDIDNIKDCVLWKYNKPPIDDKVYIYLRKNFIKHHRKVYNEHR